MVAIAICSTLPAHGRHERGRQIYQFPHWCWWSLQHPGRSSWIWWMASGICVEWDQQGQQMGCRHCLPHRSWDSFCGRDHQQQDLFACSRGTPGFTLYCSSKIPSTSSMTWHWQPQTENPLTGNPWLNPFYILELATISTPRKVEDSWIPQLQSSADRAAEVRSDIVEASIFDLHSFARWRFGHQVCTDRTVDCEERWLQRWSGFLAKLFTIIVISYWFTSSNEFNQFTVLWFMILAAFRAITINCCN